MPDGRINVLLGVSAGTSDFGCSSVFVLEALEAFEAGADLVFMVVVEVMLLRTSRVEVKGQSRVAPNATS